MNRDSGRSVPRPAQDVTDVDDAVDMTADELDVTQSGSETAEISNTLPSSRTEDETSDAD